MDKARIDQLERSVAEGIKLWVNMVGDKETFGLWLVGGPQSGTSYAGRAALTHLGTLPQYDGQQAYIVNMYDMYEDLRAIWDASSYARSEGSTAAWADRDQIDAEVSETWKCLVLMLDDWTESVPREFFMKHFYPLIRRRISAQQPLIIATRFHPSVAGADEQYIHDNFLVVDVIRNHGAG